MLCPIAQVVEHQPLSYSVNLGDEVVMSKSRRPVRFILFSGFELQIDKLLHFRGITLTFGKIARETWTQ